MTQPTQPTVVDRRRNRNPQLGPAARVSTSTLKPKTPTAAPASAAPKAKPSVRKGPKGPPMPFEAARRDEKLAARHTPVEGDNAWCADCGGLLYKTPAGPACEKGHGDPSQIAWEAAAELLYNAGKGAQEAADTMVAELEDLEAYFKELDARPPVGEVDEAAKLAILAAFSQGKSVEDVMALFPRVPRPVLEALKGDAPKVGGRMPDGEPMPSAARQAIDAHKVSMSTPEPEPAEGPTRAELDDAAVQRAAEQVFSGRATRGRRRKSKTKEPEARQAPKIDPRQLPIDLPKEADASAASAATQMPATPEPYQSEVTIKITDYGEFVAKITIDEDGMCSGVIDDERIEKIELGGCDTRKGLIESLEAALMLQCVLQDAAVVERIAAREGEAVTGAEHSEEEPAPAPGLPQESLEERVEKLEMLVRLIARRALFNAEEERLHRERKGTEEAILDLLRDFR